jgi:predicted small metal-binding protein
LVVVRNGGDPLSKGKTKTTTCPECGWTVKSPWGENDVIDHMVLHVKNHHPEMLKHSKEDMKKMIKDA